MTEEYVEVKQKKFLSCPVVRLNLKFAYNLLYWYLSYTCLISPVECSILWDLQRTKKILKMNGVGMGEAWQTRSELLVVCLYYYSVQKMFSVSFTVHSHYRISYLTQPGHRMTGNVYNFMKEVFNLLCVRCNVILSEKEWLCSGALIVCISVVSFISTLMCLSFHKCRHCSW